MKSEQEIKAAKVMRKMMKEILADGKVTKEEAVALLMAVKPLSETNDTMRSLAEEVDRALGDDVFTEQEGKKVAESLKRAALVYGIEDRPPFFESLFAALQHLFAIVVSICTPPLLIAGGLHCDQATTSYLCSMALFASGISTFIQCHRFGPIGCRLLCVQGTSFQFLGPCIACGAAAVAAKVSGAGPGSLEQYAYGLPTVFGCCFAAAPVEMLAAYCFKYLRKVITPVVSGTVVILIGLSLVKVGLITAAGGFGAMAPDAPHPFGCWQNFAASGAVIVAVVFFNCFKNRFLRMGSVVLGIGAGLVVAGVFGIHGQSVALDWASFACPTPFKYGMAFDISAIIGFAFIYLVTAIEATGDMTANSLISGLSVKDEDYQKRVSGGVLADGFNSALACCFSSFPNSIFAQNNGIIQLTGVASRYVGYFIAVALVLLGLYKPVGDLFSFIPDPVLGGATLLAFGMVASAGIRIVAQEKLTHKTALVLALSLAIGVGVELVPDALKYLPAACKQVLSNGIIVGGLVAIVANLIIPERD